MKGILIFSSAVGFCNTKRQTLINYCLRPFVSAIYRRVFFFLSSHINPRCLTIEILKINIQHSFDRNYILARMVLLPKKQRTHYYSRPKRCSQKVLQTRLLYTFPLKMYQYFKYSNSLLFPFDRCRRVASGLLISEVQAFLQKPSSIIIILIFVNRTP